MIIGLRVEWNELTGTELLSVQLFYILLKLDVRENSDQCKYSINSQLSVGCNHIDIAIAPKNNANNVITMSNVRSENRHLIHGMAAMMAVIVT